jgi:hypothetical protein
MPTQEVLSDGTIVPKVDTPDHPGAIAQVVPGSAIQAAAAAVNDKTDTQAEAIGVLGAKIGGRSRRRRAANLRRVMRMMRMKGGDVEIKNVPNMPSAGGVDPKATFGKMLEVQHQVAADAQFDDLGTAAPKVLPPAGGRRRTKKKALKHKKKGHGSRTKHRRVRKHRGSSLRTLRVRRHRR